MEKQNFNEHIDDTPSDTDVLFGRDKVMFNHIGNIRFRLVIQSRAKEYETAPSRRKKSAIVYSVVQKVHSYGGRFLRKEKNGKWRIVTVTEAIQKVGHALRDKKQHEIRIRKQGKHSKSTQRNCDMLFRLGEICSNEMKTMVDEAFEKDRGNEEDCIGRDVSSESPKPAKEPEKPESEPATSDDQTMSDREDTSDDGESEEENVAKTILQMHKVSDEEEKRHGDKEEEKDSPMNEDISAAHEGHHVRSEEAGFASRLGRRNPLDALGGPLYVPNRGVLPPNFHSITEAMDSLVPAGVPPAFQASLSLGSLLHPSTIPQSSRAAYFESMAQVARQAALAYEQAEREERARLQAVNREISQRAATLSLLAYRQQMQQAAGRPGRGEEVEFQDAFKRREAFRSVTPPGEVLSSKTDATPIAPRPKSPEEEPSPSPKRTEEKKQQPAEPAEGGGGDDKNWLVYPLSFQDYGLPSSGWKLALLPVRDGAGGKSRDR